MPIKLVSLVNRMQSFNLVCRSTRVRRDTFEYDPNTGQRHTRRGYMLMPGSLTLAAKGRPGHRSKLLPDAAALEDEIAGAERARMIQIVHVQVDTIEKEKKAEAARVVKDQKRAARKTKAAQKSRDAAIAAKRAKAAKAGKTKPPRPPTKPDASTTGAASTPATNPTETRGRDA